MTSLVVGCHTRALWPNGASQAYSYYGTLMGNPTPGIQWYKFRPPGVTPNRGMGPPVRRFLSNYFELLFYNGYATMNVILSLRRRYVSLCRPMNWPSSEELTSHQNYTLATPTVVRLPQSKKKLLTTTSTPRTISVVKVDNVISLLRFLLQFWIFHINK